MNLDQLSKAIDAGEIHTVITAFPDLQGRPVGKRNTASFFMDHVMGGGMEACDYLLGIDVDMNPLPGYEFANWELGYGDMVAHVDLSTLRVLPWQPGTAFVICDVTDSHGEAISVSPRQVLKRQIQRAADMGFIVNCATELEFYLFHESFNEAAAKGWQNLTPHATTIEDYQLLQTSRDEYVLSRIRNEMVAAGLPVESSKGEAGRGQHEVILRYAEPLDTADRHLVFKNGVKEIADQEGRAATFMAKWTMADSGSSCHIHASLWDAKSGEPLMDDPSTESGLSTIGQQFLAGQMAGGKELAWCHAPYVNSYRRYVPDSWAPTAIAWGLDNRTCGYRIVGHGAGRRIEMRVPGADVNPYISLAATIGAGLYGIEHQLELPEPFNGNAYIAKNLDRLPTDLAEALGYFQNSKMAEEIFGRDVHHHFTNTARQEWAKANLHVTDWELARNFERI